MQATLKIVGVAGTNGSGKDTVGFILARDYNFMFISVTDSLREECERRGLSNDRENTRMVSAEWRRQYGLAVLIDKAVQAFEGLPDKHKYAGLVLASLRNPAEADRIHELGGQMLWVDADPKVRYERIRNADPGRIGREADKKTYEEFLQAEQDEMVPPPGADAAVLNGAAVKEKCDLFIENNSNRLDNFQLEIATVLRLDSK